MNVRRLVPSVIVALSVGLALTDASALAAAPETPEVSVESIRATTVTLHGVLNPLASGPLKKGPTSSSTGRRAKTNAKARAKWPFRSRRGWLWASRRNRSLKASKG
jgi:hypothetical protein